MLLYLRLISVVGGIAMASLSALAAPPAVQSFDELRTLSGKTYIAVWVLALEPDGLRLQHEAGVSKVSYEDLPEEVRRQFPHDPLEAAKYASSAEAANREAIRQAEEERTRASQDELCLRAGLPAGFIVPDDAPLTIEQVKARWLIANAANPPTFGDRDRKTREAQIAAIKEEILSGARDREAEEISLRHNLDWYLHHDELAKAELARKRLADMAQEEADKKEREILAKIATSLSKLASQPSYGAEIASELARIRRELEGIREVENASVIPR